MSLASSSKSDIQLLSTSAAFAMSLGAKELFHTNFLAFLLESDDPSLVPIQLALRQALEFPLSPGAVPKCAVWREKNNLDLIVVELRLALPVSAPMLASAAPEVAPAAQGVSTADDEDAGEQIEVASGGWDWNPDGWMQSRGTTTIGAAAVTAAGTPRYVPTGNVLIVEAKLKSIPRLDQLIAYDDQLEVRSICLEYSEDAVVPEWTLGVGGASPIRIERRLLSASGVSLTTPATATRSPRCWAGVTWKSLQSAMSGAMSAIAISPMKHTLGDYTSSLGALVALVDRVHQLCDDAHSQPLGRIPTYGAVRNQPLDPQFRSLRINDLLGKTLFDYWLNNYLLKAAPLSVPTGWSLNGYVHYSNGVPGLGLELVNDAFRMPSGNLVGLRIGVQIQNCEFRLFVDVKPGWSGLESWIEKHPQQLPSQWFSTPVFGRTPVGYRGKPVMPPTRTGRATNLKVFDVSRFVYSKTDIDNESIVNVGHELWRVVAVASALAPKL